MRRSRQRGASALLILLIMVLMLVGFGAAYTLSRVGSGADERTDTMNRLAVAAAALERFVATNSRLPCPANPATTAGTEQQATAATCSFDGGTLPWLTLGLNSDAGLDAWGRKISYRVYTGNKGSLTQPGGASMVDCDTIELTSGDATPVAANAGGLCVSNPDPYMRTTTPAKFLAGKGLTLEDFGVTHDDVAYVLISHGATGFGGYTVAGGRLTMPGTDELKNTRDTGPFTIKAFSGADVEAVNNLHFDDLLVYATIATLVKRAGLEARNWPDQIVASVAFNTPTMTAALGHSPSADTGQTRIAFTNVTVTALDASGNEQNISYQGTGPNRGIGGVAGDTDLQSGVGGPEEGLRLDFGEHARQFAFALDDFGYQNTFFGVPIWIERVELRFYDVVGATATLKSTVTKNACRSDGNMATFSLDAGVDFNRVEIRPQPTTAFFTSNASSFFLSEITACIAGVTCRTATQTAANLCP